MINYFKFSFLYCIHFFHLMQVTHRIRTNKKVIWQDKSDWVIQMVDINTSVGETKDHFEDNDSVTLVMSLVNSAKSELKRRGIESFYT